MMMISMILSCCIYIATRGISFKIHSNPYQQTKQEQEHIEHEMDRQRQRLTHEYYTAMHQQLLLDQRPSSQKVQLLT